MLERTVEIQISNTTRNIILENPRTYFYSGHCSFPPRPSVPPGSSDSCHFSSPTFTGCVGVLTYVAESFTLAIYFCNPLDYNLFSMELGLEISLCKVHLSRLENTYARMSKGRSAPSVATVSDHITLTHGQKTAQVCAGPIKMMATMSNSRRSVVRVVVEDLEDSGMKAGEKPRESCLDVGTSGHPQNFMNIPTTL